MFPGEHDIDHAVADLARLLPDSLKPLARVAYDYRWSWAADGFALFKDMDAERWERYQLTGHFVGNRDAMEWLDALAKGERRPCPR